MKTHRRFIVTIVLLALLACQGRAEVSQSHPRQRALISRPPRQAVTQQAYFIDPIRGRDDADGSMHTPWRSFAHALAQLQPGDTLYLRGGRYDEPLHCRVHGQKDRPITIASYPGEIAVLSGALPEFLEAPSQAWEPAPGGGEGEYRSVRTYRNLGGVAGSFADSDVPLNTYWLLTDLQAQQEEYRLDAGILAGDVYCGPGLWYDQLSGHIHIRLAHTHQSHPNVANYRGPSDPRQLPLVIAALASTPLRIDSAAHVRLLDLQIRGAGSVACSIENTAYLQIEGLEILGGNLKGSNSGPVRLTHSAIRGRIAPWVWRIDSSKGCASGGNTRDVVRLLASILLDTSGDASMSVPRVVHNDMLRGESWGRRGLQLDSDDAARPQMTVSPRNHDWEIAACEFSDGHDGVFLLGRNMRFHHNRIENMQDDALDISGLWPSPDDSMYVYQNFVGNCVTAISTHNYGTQLPRGKAWIFRNVIDMRGGIRWNRPSATHPQGQFNQARAFLLHGADAAQHIESVWAYHNTILAPTAGLYAFTHGFMFHCKPGSTRRVFNNLFVYVNDDGIYPPPFYGLNLKEADMQVDGNLHWNPANTNSTHPRAKLDDRFLDKLRHHPLSELNKSNYPAGFGSRDRMGDPAFTDYAEAGAMSDYRISGQGAAAGQGVPLPPEWEDPLRPESGSAPDIGALPVGAKPLRAGVGSLD